MSLKVEFAKSGKTIAWSDAYDSLLELAEKEGIEIENNCRQGVCGECKVKLLSGKVSMETTDGLDFEDEQENMILPCVAVPETDVVIDA